MILYQRSRGVSSIPMVGRRISQPAVQSDVTGFWAGVVFSVLIAPLFFLDLHLVALPLPLAWGWLLCVCMFAVFFAPKALFWLAIGTYVASGIAFVFTETIPTYPLLGKSLVLHEAVWVFVSCGSIFSLLTRSQRGRWPRLRLELSGGARLALALLVALAAVATVNTFLFGSEGRWSTAIRFALPAIPLTLALRCGFDPQDLPHLMAQLRRVGIGLLVAAAIMLPFMLPDQRGVGFYSHLIMIGLVYTSLEVLTAMTRNQARRWAALAFGAFVYFVLCSGALSDMWMFAWAAALSLVAAGRLNGRPVMATLGRLLSVALVVGVVAGYMAGPAGFMSGNKTVSEVELTPAGALVSLLGDSSSNLVDRFVRWRIVSERIIAEPFALQFRGYGSEGDVVQASRIYGYTIGNNLVAHNAFLDVALWLSPLAPPLLVFLLWRFWRSMLQTAAFAPREYQLLLATCAIAAPLFWIRDVWGTWIVQGYFGASFSFWLVVVLGWLGQQTVQKET